MFDALVVNCITVYIQFYANTKFIPHFLLIELQKYFKVSVTIVIQKIPSGTLKEYLPSCYTRKLSKLIIYYYENVSV